jgi:hypothetical protein
MLTASSGPRLVGLALASAILASPSAAQAGRFLDCQEIQRDGRDQIVVGEVGLAPGADAAAAELARRRLQNRLRQQLADLAASPSGVSPVLCPGHAPSPADYTPSIVERRYGYGVLVELWGVASGSDAAITYVLLPLMLSPDRGPATSGVYDLIYRLDPQGGIAGLFAEPRELRAFTALGAGLHALAEAERTSDGALFSRAYSTLCKAASLLSETSRRAGPDGPTPAEWTALGNFAKERARVAATAGVAGLGLGGGATLARPPVGVTLGSCEVPSVDPPPMASLGAGLPR